MPTLSAVLDYGPLVLARKRRVAAWIVGLLMLCLLLIPALPLVLNPYLEMAYCGLKPGMTRAKVDQHLWMFGSRANVPYQGAASGQTVDRYELLWFGKSGSIQVIYDVNGTVVDPQPIFRD